ncbi:glutathione ABC transporter substrate-binding protein [Paramaledivibacter caminithermalis]|jgi:glutathione transport system substrate-binding protein|uniref:Glutathione-binding protein GsiB n=1 Tax=Paramaledivibacter caminithermalis (strain DSM 15212 / CIP 107654 / DViRD3) TaxID=1121301 RepID=A0A1M6NQN9_PARC5|nr:glutathione ABC transporter substrate-binding protein [Paramaledivibacter caminithermalis]SHJ98033.1 glutathione transport system substrate-binding protein [Paramaledivibacter caminithermalis DSM 15212]
MKKLIALFIVIVMSVTFVACSNNTEEAGNKATDETATNTPVENEDVNMTIAVNAEIISLDPHDISDTLSGSATSTMYESLYDYKLDMSLEPVLATGYDVSEDGLEYTFYIREGVTFHDGTPLNAEAVKYNFDRVSNKEKNLKRRRNLLHVVSTEVIDEYTLLVKLDAPFAPMLNRIASIKIISPAALEKYGDKGIITNPVGTGPYVFEEWTPGDKMVVRTNENYWREGPKIDTLTFKPVTENGARIAMLQTGDADFIYPMPTEQVKAVEGDKNIEVIEGPSTIARFTFLNMSKEIFSDVRVRQAINYAIDKKAYAKVVKSGYAVPLTSHVPSTITYHVAQPEYEYNLEKAKKLMAEAGYPNGFKTHIWAPNDTENMKGMQFISQQLSKIGIEVEVVPMEEGTLSDSIYKAKTPEESTVNMWYVSWSAFDFDGATAKLFHSANIPPTAPNVSYYMNPKADELIEAGAIEVDPEKRAKIYAELQEIIWNDAPWIFLGSDVLLSAKRSTTEGIFVDPSGGIIATQAATSK